MRVDLFDFSLPDTCIALRPASPRDSARLLVVKPGEAAADRNVHALASLLKAGDALVFNDTRVLPAQLEGRRERNGQIAAVSATLHMRVSADQWKAFLRPAKRVAAGERIAFARPGTAGTLDAIVSEKGEAGEALLTFDLSGPDLDMALHAHGHIPLPPYISAKRAEDDRDRSDYQTIYARKEGAVAAPTAGLHFTPELFAALDAKGVSRHFVTLHVGAGTFLPVKADDTADHRMHGERGEVTAETARALNAVRAAGGRIIAVGTTSLRLMESSVTPDGKFAGWAGETRIFITPGHQFRTADMLMTNFHLPKSTLFMLVSAFSGLETMHAAYRHAIETGYRFYSYGDACLLERAHNAFPPPP